MDVIDNRDSSQIMSYTQPMTRSKRRRYPQYQESSSILISLGTLPIIFLLSLSFNAFTVNALCSCGPTSYQFQISLSKKCTSSASSGLGGLNPSTRPGITNTLCYMEEVADGTVGNIGGIGGVGGVGGAIDVGDIIGSEDHGEDDGYGPEEEDVDDFFGGNQVEQEEEESDDYGPVEGNEDGDEEEADEAGDADQDNQDDQDESSAFRNSRYRWNPIDGYAIETRQSEVEEDVFGHSRYRWSPLSDGDGGGNRRNTRHTRGRKLGKTHLSQLTERDMAMILQQVDPSTLSTHVDHATNPPLSQSHDVHHPHNHIRNQNNQHNQHTQHNQHNHRNLQLFTPIKSISVDLTHITSLLFLEIDTTTDLNIINQDSTYFRQELPDGVIVNFTSISSNLTMGESLEDQMEFLPGGVMMLVFGRNDASAGDGTGGDVEDGEVVVVQQTIAWGYDVEECGVEPLMVGDSIGWVTLTDYTPAKQAFCPAAPKVIEPKSIKSTKSSKLLSKESNHSMDYHGYGSKAGKPNEHGDSTSSDSGSNAGKAGKVGKGAKVFTKAGKEETINTTKEPEMDPKADKAKSGKSGTLFVNGEKSGKSSSNGGTKSSSGKAGKAGKSSDSDSTKPMRPDGYFGQVDDDGYQDDNFVDGGAGGAGGVGSVDGEEGGGHAKSEKSRYRSERDRDT